ncbi:hypothetical protein BU24DRAFT_428458 [Aaosphaeria arxii CBS 175.79]|uniref:DUF3835 domain-containing protein n=1 Tax=Aaosphaeria arxii CBS 175.79 TaxID=1450172 RepID=A0A6A5X917_9PLEO|nr:uncharacterized protein BU24DRAFT_428458 [Aaosphaeria arxii CBS 175.79]KAF2009565.1 hypothetical protein BU24DRAFT_428458 [Aaosphaeria arxii CBS 175.79]
MASTQQLSMDNIERKRTQLEENVTKLKQALRHWQTWELEYGFFKEEIENASNPTSSEITEMGRNLEGELLTEKEVQDLLGKDSRRTANQVIDMISRRMDYVQQNISTVEKQLDTAEKQFAGASILTAPDTENEEGLPLMDIVEELDEEGNVISGEVLQPGKEAPELVEALRKTGIEKLMLKDEAPAQSIKKDNITDVATSSTPKTPVAAATDKDDASSPRPPKAKKSVSFKDQNAEETIKKPVSAAKDTDPTPPSKKQTLEANGYNGDVSDFNFAPGSKVIEVDDDWNEVASYPVVPQGDTPEEAALRKQMLQYGLSEVGNVVAEIDLEGRDDDYSDEDMDDDYDEDYDSADEEEDQYGRSTKRELSDDYRQKMQELEQKLNARMLENVGPRPELSPLAQYSDDLRTLRVRKDEADQQADGQNNEPTESSQKKGVRFADTLDISEAPQAPIESRRNLPSTSTTTMSETIIERVDPSSQASPMAPSKPAKVSRFKSARAGSSQGGFNSLPMPPAPVEQAFPAGPEGRTLADSIVEHDAHGTNAQPPDEFDPALIKREVQAEYHKMRNKMIQQQGGFTPSEEDTENPIVEEKDGKTKRVSRFKAARLKAEGL